MKLKASCKLQNKIIASTQSLSNLQCIEISLHEFGFSSLQELLLDVVSTNSRSDLMNCGTSFSKQDAELVSSVILFNFGISIRLLASGEADENIISTTLEQSRRLFQLSLTSLNAQYEQCKDEVSLALNLFVSAQVLGSLERICIELGDAHGTMMRAGSLADVRLVANEILEEYSSLWGSACHCISASAA